MNLLIIVIPFLYLCSSYALKVPRLPRDVRSGGQLGMTLGSNFMMCSSQLLADTSVGEEEILAIQGTSSDLPDPIFAVAIAVVLFIGVGALQFTLGDLNKEEGQARVRDFLATRRDTERKRGYFD